MTTKTKAPAKPTRRTRQEAAPAEGLAPSNITPIPYGRLKRAPENVRKTNIAADVESLADDIGAHGLLQSLIGYAGDTPIDKDVVWIVGGGRRLQALELLHQRGAITDEWPVSVLIRDQAEAIELSLSENLARRDMNPADEFEAFAALMKTGATSPAQLGKRFGFTERYVKQRLRLATLAPDILEAVREGTIGVESAMAYARTPDTALQLKVFKAQSAPNTWNAHSTYSIRSAYDAEQLDTDATVFRFIDAATYEKEGGGYEEDLFAGADEQAVRRLTHGDLAMAIAERCANLQALKLVASERETHPSIGDFVLPKGLTHGGKLQPPAGHVEIRGGYNYDLYQEIDLDEIWTKVDALTDAAVIPIYLDRALGKLPDDADEDGERPIVAELKVDRSLLFVPKAIAEQVLPPKKVWSHEIEARKTPEEREAEQLLEESRLWAARLAVPKFSEVEGLEGRCFYADNWLDTRRVKPGEPRDAVPTPSFTVRVYVTDDEIAAKLEDGKARALQAREYRARAEAEREAREQAEAAALAAKIEEITALDDEPAVIMVDGPRDGVLQPCFRRDDGSYFDSEGEGYPSLDDLLEYAQEIGDHWPTREAYDAARPADAEPEVEPT